MESTPQQHEHVHAEIVHLKDLGLGKEEDKHTNELGEGDTTDDRGPHVGQRVVCSLDACLQVAGAEPTHDVRAKLHRYPNSLQGNISVVPNSL